MIIKKNVANQTELYLSRKDAFRLIRELSASLERSESFGMDSYFQLPGSQEVSECTYQDKWITREIPSALVVSVRKV